MKFKEAQKKAVSVFDSPEFITRIREEDSTMVKQLPILQEINRRGFLTIESQAGLQKRGKSVFTGKPYMIAERSYISGFMLENVAAQFIQYMGLHTDKNAIYVAHCSGVDIPVALDIPLTIETTDGPAAQRVFTHTSTVLPTEVWEMYRKQLHINKSEKIVFILCWDPVWNRTGALFKDVVRALATCNANK